MDTIATTPEGSASPEPPEEPGSGRRRLRQLTLAVLAAGAIAAVVATAAVAADETPSPGSSPGSSSGETSPPSAGDRPELRRFGHHGIGPGMDLLGFALHGEAVVPDGDDGYQTVVGQRGEVTDVGSDEITVESEDGFRETYTVPADALVNAARDGLSTIEKGDEVSVFAVRDGDDLTAQRVVDLSKLADLRERLWPDGIGPGDESNSGGESSEGTGRDIRLDVTVDAV